MNGQQARWAAHQDLYDRWVELRQDGSTRMTYTQFFNCTAPAEMIAARNSLCDPYPLRPQSAQS